MQLPTVTNCYALMSPHVSSIFSENLAAQYSATSVQNPQYQPQTAEALSGFSDNVLGFQTALAELGAGHGLANFDKTNDVEILIKNMDNLIKDVLTATVQLVDQLPVIGPVLGPIIYDIKCYIDEILNLVENLTDATINALQPVLQASLGSAIMASCRCGVKVLGLCI
ncbi:hypothetical protein BJ138DRAFT_1007091 [Hygrophoropsis aurantiaca]|uniref:Uncharacterized protein n=1 Tax=Hygrophoropsis aurantiaca TaxID=72124 RepID=A0ACB8ACZ6_9AGAM|nr:hypothetical protein BJ138DRAFT_1007091 [Hygrophoropsis aurantiaca]